LTAGPVECGAGLMASVNEWVMMRMMMNLTFVRREEGKPGADTI
jgi:hypothetical protein